MKIKNLFFKIPENPTYMDERLKIGITLLIISFLLISIAITVLISPKLGISMLVFQVLYITTCFILSGLENKDKG